MRISRTPLGLALTGACSPAAEKPLPTAAATLPTAAEATPTAAQIPTTQAPARLALGYYTGIAASLAALITQAAYINGVSVDVYSVQMDGRLAGADPYAAAVFARAHGLFAYACVSNWNSDPAVAAFDPALAEAALVEQYDLAGLSVWSLGQADAA